MRFCLPHVVVGIAAAFVLAAPAARAFTVENKDAAGQYGVPKFDLEEQSKNFRKDGTALNVRALYQRCPHLGCRPNPCLKNFWFECPCHGSRYDRLGIKADGARFGPAPEPTRLGSRKGTTGF